MLKIERDLANIKDKNAISIVNQLLENAQNDSLIKETLNKENKSIEGMIAYVRSEAQKQAQNGMAMIERETVFGWAQHYYDEDSINFEPKENVKIIEKQIKLPKEDLGAFDI